MGEMNGRNKIESLRKMEQTITVTFGDVAENNIGMEKIGQMSSGFTRKDLKEYQRKLKNLGVKSSFFNLNRLGNVEDVEGIEDASILVIRDFLQKIGIDKNEFLEEQSSLEWDSTIYSRKHGRVVNKNARHNLCYSNYSQEPDIENLKGRVVSFSSLPLLNRLKIFLEETFGEKCLNLVAEGNKYYNTKKCGIGYHGDAERSKVLALRLGSEMSLHYQWYQNSKPIGDNVCFKLNSGDFYIMSAKAVGQDWKKRLIPTLRHAAGCDKYTAIKEK